MLEKFKKGKGFSVGIAVVIALSISGIFFSMGKYVPLLPCLSVTAELVSESVQQEACGAIVDTMGTRAILTDGQKKVTTVLSGGLPSARVKKFGGIAVHENIVYVQETVYDSSRDLIVSDSVVCYSPDGRKLGTVLEFDYDPDASQQLESELLDIFIADGKGMAVIVGAEDGSIGLVTFPLTPSDTAEEGESAVESLGALPGREDAYDTVFEDETGSLYILGTLGSVFRYDASSGTFETVELEKSMEEKSTITVLEDGSVAVASQFGDEGMRIPFSTGLVLRLLWFWMGLFLLTLCLLCFMISSIMGAVKKREYARLKAVAILLCALLAVCVIVNAYTEQIKTLASQNKEALLRGMTILAYENDADAYLSAVEEYEQSGEITPSVYQSVSSIMGKNAKKLAKNGCTVEFILIAGDGESGNYLMNSSRTLVAGTAFDNMQYSQIDYEDRSSDVFSSSYNNVWGTYDYAVRILRNDRDEVKGLFVTFSNTDMLLASLRAKQLRLLATLISTAVAVTFLVFEMRMWFIAFQSRRELVRQNADNPVVPLARPLFFLGCSSDCVATSMVVLIARDMLTGTSALGDTLLLSLPLMANTLGLLGGNILFIALSKRFPIRWIMAVTQSLACASFLMMALSARMQNLCLLIVFMFVASFFGQAGPSFGASLPFHFSNEKSLGKANMAIATTGISVASLCTLAAGGIATVWGNAAVFAFAAVFPILYLLLILIGVPKHSIAGETTPLKKGTLRNYRKFLMNPHLAILVVCVMGVIVFSTGYKSYMLPLILADNGLTKSDFANTIVLCNAAVFFAVPAVSQVSARIGYRRSIIIVLLFIFAAFFGFLMNNTLTWAVVALIILLMCDKVGKMCFKTFWPRANETHCVSNVEGVVLLDSVDKIQNTLKSPLWGALAAVGQTFASGVAALLSAAAAVVFMLVSRKGPFSDQKSATEPCRESGTQEQT